MTISKKDDTHDSLPLGPGLLGNSSRLESICDEVVDLKEMMDFIRKEARNNLLVSRYGLFEPNDRSDGNEPKRILKADGNEVFEGATVQSLSPLIDQLRLHKSPSEHRALRRACLIGSKALKSTMEWTRQQLKDNQDFLNIPFINEAQIVAKFDFESRVHGAAKVAFPPVCAGGPRSTVIHYSANNQFLSPHEWLLMDAGCEDIEGYNSDISRR